MKLVFMGTPDFAVPSLDKLFQSSHQVVAVVTGPDKPVGRGQKLRPTPVKKLALSYGVPIFTPDKLSAPDFITELNKIQADLFVVVAFKILPVSVFTIPPLGTINLHASLLPKYRGAAPINWAIINGERETGVTTFFIEEKVDTGGWILQQKIAIGEEETAGELHDKLSLIGANVLVETVDLIAQGRAKKSKQSGEVTKAPKITRSFCRIDWGKDAQSIFNLIRGLSPYPRAFSTLKGKEIKILRSKVVAVDSITNQTPGSVVAVEKDRLIVNTGRGRLAITELQPENKRQMSTAEYLLGHKVSVGDRFGE